MKRSIAKLSGVLWTFFIIAGAFVIVSYIVSLFDATLIMDISYLFIGIICVLIAFLFAFIYKKLD